MLLIFRNVKCIFSNILATTIERFSCTKINIEKTNCMQFMFNKQIYLGKITYSDVTRR